MNSLTNNFAFYIMQIVCSEGILLGGSNVLDKAQIEKSVLYPAFLFLGGGGILEEESVMGMLMEKRKNRVYTAKNEKGSKGCKNV